MELFTIYPPIWDHWFTQLRPDDPARLYFNVARVINPCPSFSICISCSFFKANAANRYPNEYPVDDAAFAEKYERRLHENLARPQWDTKTTKLRIYLASDMEYLVDAILNSGLPVEIYLMSTCSIGHNPGAMWRFLALTDTSLSMVHVSDIDCDIKGPIETASLLIANPDKAVCKPYARDPTLHIQRNIVYAQYNLFQASGFTAIPAKMALKCDMATLMAAFWVLMRDHPPKTAITIFSVPRPGHPRGWGQIPSVYGFDETFLKRYLYPHLVSKGLLMCYGDSSCLEGASTGIPIDSP